VAELLESLGHEVVEAAPPLDAGDYSRTYRRFWPMTTGRNFARFNAAAGGGLDPAAMEPFNQHLYELSRNIKANDFVLDLAWFHAMARGFANFMLDYDVWLTPTLGHPPPPLGHFDAVEHGADKIMDRFMEFLPFTPFCNMTGQPAATVPLNWNAAGLPVGTHLIGRYADEATLFRLSAQLEAARPWRDRVPPISALT
jgi:amidase